MSLEQEVNGMSSGHLTLKPFGHWIPVAVQKGSPEEEELPDEELLEEPDEDPPEEELLEVEVQTSTPQFVIQPFATVASS